MFYCHQLVYAYSKWSHHKLFCSIEVFITMFQVFVRFKYSEFKMFFHLCRHSWKIERVSWKFHFSTLFIKFLNCRCSFMTSKIRRNWQRFTELKAFVRFFTSICLVMTTQMRLLGKLFCTVEALVRFFASLPAWC